ncbi:hypothetical protein J6590_062525 [Homalodisca vitripennis]|nr:hypothetical protein J6590_062525 [Homalodisca vitripennis]
MTGGHFSFSNLEPPETIIDRTHNLEINNISSVAVQMQMIAPEPLHQGTRPLIDRHFKLSLFLADTENEVSSPNRHTPRDLLGTSSSHTGYKNKLFAWYTQPEAPTPSVSGESANSDSGALMK